MNTFPRRILVLEACTPASPSGPWPRMPHTGILQGCAVRRHRSAAVETPARETPTHLRSGTRTPTLDISHERTLRARHHGDFHGLALQARRARSRRG